MDYASITNKSKEKNDIPEKKVEAVVEAPAKLKKKSMVEEFIDLFLPEDRPNLKEYLVKDIVVPTVKKAIVSSVDMFFNGTTTTTKSSPSSKISYNSIYSKTPTSRVVPNTVRTYDYGTVIFESRAEAEAVLIGLQDLIDVYRIASVNDLFDLARLTGDATSAKWGWTSIEGARVEMVDGGYALRLPKARPID